MVYPASVTPFDGQGRIDHAQMARLLAYFRAAGCEGAVLAGTNGEGPSLSAVEKRDLVRMAVPLAQGLDIVLGISTPSLDEAIWLASQASKSGAAAALVMAPGYFREASEEGIARWFETLMDASPLPILLYNFPQRTGIVLSAELAARLGRHEHVIGLKDSSGDRANLPAYARALPGKRLFVGDETLLLEALAHGWTGTISGAANIVPEWLVQILQDEDPESRETKFQFLLPALRSLRSGSQPSLNKALLARRKVLDCAAVRLPLLDATDDRIDEAESAVASVGIRFAESR